MSVNPDPTSNDTQFGNEVREILINAGVTRIVDCTNHFPSVSSGKISYFICSKDSPQPYSFNTTQIIDVIASKVCAKNSGFVMRGSQKSLTVETSNKPTKSKSVAGLFGITTTGLDIRYIDSSDKITSKKYNHLLNGPFFVINRFFGKNTPDPVTIVKNIENYFIGYNVMVIKATDGETVENFQSVYGSKLYRAVIANIRKGSFDITQSGLASLERLDLKKLWSDSELYAYFQLTPEEIDYIESSAVKK